MSAPPRLAGTEQLPAQQLQPGHVVLLEGERIRVLCSGLVPCTAVARGQAVKILGCAQPTGSLHYHLLPLDLSVSVELARLA